MLRELAWRAIGNVTSTRAEQKMRVHAGANDDPEADWRKTRRKPKVEGRLSSVLTFFATTEGRKAHRSKKNRAHSTQRIR